MHAAYNDSQPLVIVSAKQRCCSRPKLIFACLLALVVLTIVIVATLPSTTSPVPSPSWHYSADSDQRVIEIFRDYLKINSALPNSGNNALIFLKNIADFYGLESQRLDYNIVNQSTKSALLVSRRIPSSTLPSVFLLSHVDTVGVELDKWKHDPFGGEIDAETGNIYGRGAQDAKSLSIMQLEALYRLKDLPLNRSVFLFFETQEEISKGTACEPQWLSSPLCQSLNVGVVLDEGLASGAGSDDFLFYYGERLDCALNAKAEGPAGHGSLMLNNTAPMKLIKFLGKLLELRAEQEALLVGTQLGFVTTINPTLLSGGSTINVVPSSAEAGTDLRITPGQVQNITQVILQLAIESDVTLSYGLCNLSEPVLSPHNNSDFWWKEITSILEYHLSNTTNGTLVKGVFPAGTTGNCLRFAPRSLPVYGFSPMPRTPMLLHDHDEFLNNDTLVDGVVTYQMLLAKLAGL